MIVKNFVGTVDSWFAWEVRDFLKQNKDKEVRLVVTSQGGNVAQAIAISDLLASHGNVTVEFSGVAASAATWMAFGANKVVMHEDTLWLCHQCSVPVMAWENMKADELDDYINKLQSEKKSLEVLDAIVAKKYLDRCNDKKNLKDVCDLMKEERYLAPADVLAWGFVDEVLPTKTASNVVNSILLKELNLPEANFDDVIKPKFDEESFINRIVEKVKNFFAPAPKVEEPKNKSNSEENPNNIIMNKDFSFVNALLNVEGVNTNESNIVLTVEQMKAIENRLAEVDKAEKSLDKVSDKVAAMTGIENKVNAVSLIIDHIPAVQAPAAQLPAQQADEKNGYEIENADEVNEFVNQYRK